MQKQTLTLLAPPIIAAFLLIGGCDKQEKRTGTSTPTSQPSTYLQEESYDCSSLEDDNNPLKQTWCEAKAFFEQKESLRSDSNEFKQYLRGYRSGINDARQAKVSRITQPMASQNDSFENQGYRDGYEIVITQLGLIEFDGPNDEMPSEYKERWLEAADSYRLSGLESDNNPFLKGRYIDGYMAGGRIALTVPTSMESFFNGDTPEGKQPSIIPPEGDMPETQLAFYRGFDEGYKAMMASIRDSINQVMEQMQEPNNMQLPEGMAPPAPPAG